MLFIIVVPESAARIQETEKKRKSIDQLSRIQADCPELYSEYIILLHSNSALLMENKTISDKNRILAEDVKIHSLSGAFTILRSLYEVVIARFRIDTWERAKLLYYEIFQVMPVDDKVVLHHLPNDILLKQRRYLGTDGAEHAIEQSYGRHCDDVIFMRSLSSSASRAQLWRERFADHCSIANLPGHPDRRASDEDVRTAIKDVYDKLSNEIHQIGARFENNGIFVLPRSDKYSEAEVFALATVVKEAGLDPLYPTGLQEASVRGVGVGAVATDSRGESTS